MRCTLGGLCGLALAGCSFLYNPNNLPPAEDVDAAVADADPTMPALVDISPDVIFEGQGEFGSAPALLVLRGKNLVSENLTVTLTPPDGVTVKLEPITDAVVSANHDYLAFTVTARIDDALAVDVPLDVVIQQAGGSGTTTLTGKLTLRGLPELRSSASLTAPLGRYSVVDATTVTVTGDMPAVLDAVSSITVGTISASARGPAPGPGGHAGQSIAGACATPGGGGGRGGDAMIVGLLVEGGGGGGAGGTAMGSSGTTGIGLGIPGAGGVAGVRSGVEGMSSLTGNAACAGGGGGVGGTLVLLGSGGRGGGGGGTLVLAAGGDVAATSIAARGGNGDPGTAGGAGGGGGAGGNVLVRTDTGTLTLGTVDVAGGSGGQATAGPTARGGAGSAGRVRWDAPGGDPPVAGARRGPAFAALAARTFTMDAPSFTIVGSTGERLDIRVIDHDGQARDQGRTSLAAGMTVISPKLLPGHNQVCITLDGGGENRPESDKCIDVAYLP